VIENDDSYGYGYGYGYGGYSAAPRGLTRGWGGQSPAVSGYAARGQTGTFATYCAQARAALCALDSASPSCTGTCAFIQQQIQSDCTLFDTQSATDVAIRQAAQCIDGVWTGACPQPAYISCAAGGCTGNPPATGCTCVAGQWSCPGGGDNTLLLVGAVGLAIGVAVLFALEGPAKKTITIARPA